MEHSYFINTENLNLRPVMLEDISDIMIWRNSKEIRKWFFNSDTVTYEEQVLWYKNYLNNENEIMFIIENKFDHVPIGTISITNINWDNNTGHIGRVMVGNSNLRGKGIGKESIKSISKFAINTLGLKQLFAEIYKDNISSIQSFKKAGYKIIEENALENNKTVVVVSLV